MKKILCLLIWSLLLGGCAVNRYRSDFEFANRLAREGLWQEAYYRWQKVLAARGGSAALHNNLAVALESLGRADEAEKEYELALKLAPADTYIQNNYNSFKKNMRKKENEK